MGVEPTRDGAGRPATVLKTGRATGPLPLPYPYLSGRSRILLVIPAQAGIH